MSIKSKNQSAKIQLIYTGIFQTLPFYPISIKMVTHHSFIGTLIGSASAFFYRHWTGQLISEKIIYG